jgi:tetratricopeptide (TPR) repeat protein
LGPDQQILVRRLLVFSLVDAGETRRALKLLDDWIGEKTDPSVESLRSLRIIVLGEAEKATKASNVALEWIRKAPTAMAPRQALISVLHEQEKLDEALTMIRQWQKDLREIAEQDPARKDVAQVTLDWLGQAALLNRIEAQDWDKGLEIANELLADQPDSADVLQFKATCLGELGRREDQIRILKEIQSANPDDPGINNNLGYFYADAGENLSEAEQLIRKSLRREPSSIAAQDSLGWVFYKQGRFSLAGEVFLRLVERGRDQLRELEPEQSSPVHPIIFDHAGDAFFRLGWPNLAREAWDLALEAARVETQESADLEYVKSKTPGKIEALDTGDQPELAPYDETYLEKNPQETDGDVPDPAIPLPGI